MNLSLWDVKPEIVSLSKSKVEWKPSVHRLRNAILNIIGHESQDFISFVFHGKVRPFKENHKVDVLKEHYEAAKVAVELDPAFENEVVESTIAVMFTVSPNDHPCKLVKVSHEKTESRQSASPFCDAAYFRDCFQLGQF